MVKTEEITTDEHSLKLRTARIVSVIEAALQFRAVRQPQMCLSQITP